MENSVSQERLKGVSLKGTEPFNILFFFFTFKKLNKQQGTYVINL